MKKFFFREDKSPLIFRRVVEGVGKTLGEAVGLCALEQGGRLGNQYTES